MPKIKNMGTATMRFKEGVIITGSAGIDDSALVVTGSTVLSGSGTRPALDVYGSLSGEYVAIIDNDQNSSGHVLKLLTDGNGSGSRVLEMIDGDGDTIFRARADGRFGFGPDGVSSMGAGTFVVGIDNSSHTSDIAISQRLQHLGDSNTYMDFPSNDNIEFTAGGKSMIKMIEGTIDQVLIMSGGAGTSPDVKTSTDTNFFVSGTIGSRGSSTAGTSVFGGDLVVSGAFSAGALTFPTSDGTNNQVIKTDGNGNLSFTNQSGGGGGSSSLIVGFTTIGGASGVVAHDCSSNQTFYHNYISGAISPNFTNLSISSGEATVTKLILDQGATAYDIEAVSVGGTESSLVWEGSRPSPVANQVSFAKFEILRISNSYTVIGAFSSTVTGGPVDIPNNSLLYLDASNSNSYAGSGTTWTDLSPNSKNGTLVNTPTWSSTYKWFEFSGSSNQHITLPTGFADFTSGATFFFVADLGTGNHWERLLDFSGGGDAINVGRNQSGTNMTLEYYNPSKTATTSNIIQNNTLANYVVTTDGTSAKFYRNGTLITTNSFTRVPGNSDRTQNYIGRSRSGGDAYYEGKIAVVAIFNRTLTDSEISDLYNHYDAIYSF